MRETEGRGGKQQIGKIQYGDMEPYKYLPKKYFYDDSSIMEGFAKFAKAQAKAKLN